MAHLVKYVIFFQLCLFSLLPCTAQASTPVCLVLSDDSTLYDEVTSLIESSLSSEVTLQIAYTETFDSNDVLESSLIVPVGRRAAEKVSSVIDDHPIIYSFIEAQTLNHIFSDSPPHRWQASVINQPLSRLIKTAQPLIRNEYRNKLLIVIAKSNVWAQSQIDNLPPDLRDIIEVMIVEQGDVAARLIDDSFYKVAAVVAVNDTVIWSGNSAKWILHQAYNYQVPVVGYAQTFQKAGAMISVYSSLSQIAETTAGLINDWAKNKQLSSTGFVYSDYKIEVNEFIARALSYQPDKIIIKRD